MRKTLFILFLSLTASVIFSCMNSVSEYESAALTVNLPDSRALVDNDASVSSYSGGTYSITVSGSTTVTKEAAAGESVTFESLAPGSYTVSAAYYYDGECVAYGTAEAEVQAGVQSSVSLTLSLNKYNRISGMEEKDGNIYAVLSNGYEYEIQKTGLTTVNSSDALITGSGKDGVFIQARVVTLSPYAIGTYEVTQELYESVMGTNPSKNTTADNEETQELMPVDYVSWYDAVLFCNELTKLAFGESECVYYSDSSFTTVYSSTESTAVYVKSGATGYRLPTEAEWEFAARGGDISEAAWDYAYAGTNDDESTGSFGDYAWYTYNSNNKTHEVGLKEPNTLGLYDMCGNVAEWTYDIYGDVGTTAVVDPVGASSGTSRNRRGGNYQNEDYSTYCSVKYRKDDTPNSTYNILGFRIARSL